MGGDKQYAAAEGISWTDTGGDLLLFNNASGSYHALNPQGSAVWRAMGEGATEDEIVGRIMAKFGARAEIIESDVADFLGKALAGGLIVAR